MLVLMALGVFVAAGPAQAVFPGANGKIAFSAQRPAFSFAHVYVMDPDGTGQLSIGAIEANDQGAAWSPDGQKIAFTSSRHGDQEIYVMNADGSNQQRLTNSAETDTEATWSPNGEKIAFRSNRDGDELERNLEIYVMNADGSNQQRLTNHVEADFTPAWSPDGNKIAFTSRRDGNDEIYVMNTDGSGLVNRSNNPGQDDSPNWSPDGQKIAFTSARDDDFGEIYVMNADGTNQVRRTNNAAVDGSPAWSPDGSKIAFLSDRDGNNEIHVMNADGTNQVNRTNNAGADVSPDWQRLAGAVAITSGPSGTTNQTSVAVEFVFIGESPPAGHFECRLDEGSFVTCTSPKAFTGLTDGSHHVDVRYKPDEEDAGPVATRSVVVDATPPTVTLDEAPSGADNPPDATIRFHASEAGAAFVCTLDQAAPFDCSSPVVLADRPAGVHDFEVVAADAAGNFSLPAHTTWQVRGAAPPAAPAFECPLGESKTVAFGVIVAIARSEAACFVREAVAEGDAFVSRGNVSVNGILLMPSSGTKIIVDSTLTSGLVRVTGEVKLQAGDVPLGWTLSNGFTFDGLAQGQLQAINKVLSLGEGVQDLAGLPVQGGVSLELSADNGGQTRLTPRLTLPRASFQALPGLSPEAAGLTVEVPITVSNDLGLTGGIRLKLGEAHLFGRVKVKDLDLFYDHTTRSFEGSAGIRLTENTPAGRAEPTFTVALSIGPLDGVLGIFRKLSFQVSSLNRPIGGPVFLQRFGATLEKATDGDGNELARFAGSAGISLGPRVRLGSFETELVSMDGSSTLDIPTGPQPPEPFTYTASGTMKVFDVAFNDATIRYIPPARVELAGKIDESLFGYGFVGSLAVDADGNPLSWASADGVNLEVHGEASFGIAGSPDPADAVFSTTGYAICVGEAGDRMGFGQAWGGDFHTFANSCDLGPYRAGARAAQAGGALTTSIPRGARLVLLSVRGEGAPPKVTVEGPNGERFVTPAGPEEIDERGARIVQDPETDTTHVVLRRPAAGRWAVSPQDGSAHVTALDVADALPPLRIRANVAGRGPRRVLSWRAGPLPGGQRLVFTERGTQTANVLTTTTRRRGRLKFTPDPAPGRSRTIELTVTRDGLPRLTRKVARFSAPAPPRLRRVSGLRLRGRMLRWKAQPAAAGYSLLITTADRTTTSRTARRARLRLSAAPPRGVVKVTILARDAQGRIGPAANARLRVK